MNERRAVQRVLPEEPLRAKVHASFPVRILDISERGAQLEVERSLRPNVGCELRFPSPDGEFVMRATVRRCRAWGFALSESDQRVLVFRAGVEFDNPDSELLTRLRLAVEPQVPRQHVSVESKEATTEQAPESLIAGPGPAATLAPAAADDAPAPPTGSVPRGPVKIRIRSDHVRRILRS